MKNFLIVAASILLDMIGGGFDRCSSKHYDDVYLNVSTNTVELDAQGAEASFVDVSSNSHWRVSNRDRWFIIQPTEGKNDGRISITAMPNGSTADRSSFVLISCGDIHDDIKDINIEVKVVQKGKEE